MQLLAQSAARIHFARGMLLQSKHPCKPRTGLAHMRTCLQRTMSSAGSASKRPRTTSNMRKAAKNLAHSSPAHLLCQQSLLPHQRVGGRQLQHAQHHKQDVLAQVALGMVWAGAVWVPADLDSVHCTPAHTYNTAQWHVSAHVADLSCRPTALPAAWVKQAYMAIRPLQSNVMACMRACLKGVPCLLLEQHKPTRCGHNRACNGLLACSMEGAPCAFIRATYRCR